MCRTLTNGLYDAMLIICKDPVAIHGWAWVFRWCYDINITFVLKDIGYVCTGILIAWKL